MSVNLPGRRRHHVVRRSGLAILLATQCLFSGPLLATDTSYRERGLLSFLSVVDNHIHAHGGAWRPALGVVYPPLLASQELASEIRAVQEAGYAVTVATANDPDVMRELLELRIGSITTDFPDVLQSVLAEERVKAGTGDAAYFDSVEILGHRGARGLRPESTLPSFEAGLDFLVSTLELDTGITDDGHALIWHDPELRSSSCRPTDGSRYAKENEVLIMDLQLEVAQRTFICDQTPFHERQDSALSSSPVSVAFARLENLPSPHAPLSLEQLFRFVDFYASYYRSGAGASSDNAKARWKNASRVRFSIETKSTPLPSAASPRSASQIEKPPARTPDPARFVESLAKVIHESGFQERVHIQSFDYRTLVLLQQNHPQIPTQYWTDGSGAVRYRPSELW